MLGNLFSMPHPPPPPMSHSAVSKVANVYNNMGEISIREKDSKIELEPSQQYINSTHFKYTLGRGKGKKIQD